MRPGVWIQINCGMGTSQHTLARDWIATYGTATMASSEPGFNCFVPICNFPHIHLFLQAQHGPKKEMTSSVASLTRPTPHSASLPPLLPCVLLPHTQVMNNYLAPYPTSLPTLPIAAPPQVTRFYELVAFKNCELKKNASDITVASSDPAIVESRRMLRDQIHDGHDHSASEATDPSSGGSFFVPNNVVLQRNTYHRDSHPPHHPRGRSLEATGATHEDTTHDDMHAKNPSDCESHNAENMGMSL